MFPSLSLSLSPSLSLSLSPLSPLTVFADFAVLLWLLGLLVHTDFCNLCRCLRFFWDLWLNGSFGQGLLKLERRGKTTLLVIRTVWMGLAHHVMLSMWNNFRNLRVWIPLDDSCQISHFGGLRLTFSLSFLVGPRPSAITHHVGIKRIATLARQSMGSPINSMRPVRISVVFSNLIFPHLPGEGC